jgi:glycosyltransferase involved in cell wall biosynthesis
VVFEFMDEIDIYIQPSKQEGLPRAIVEAMSRGCPVIASNIAGIPELISKDALFTPGKIIELKELILSLKKEKLKVWAIENFERSKNFQTEILNNKRLSFYNEFKRDFNYFN